ncbi:MAG: hypothetical protein WCA97_15465 [Terriglobales bacterium]|jgi:hypothetical protein
MTKTERIKWLEVLNDALCDTVARTISGNESAACDFVLTAGVAIAEARQWAEAARSQAKRIVFEDDTIQ